MLPVLYYSALCTWWAATEIKFSICDVFVGPGSGRPYKIHVVGNNCLIGNAVFSEALRIFLSFCMKLGDYKGGKITELDFWKKFLIWRYSQKGLQISIGWLVGWLVGDAVFSETAIRIFLIFCIKLGDYKGRKVTELVFLPVYLTWKEIDRMFCILYFLIIIEK